MKCLYRTKKYIALYYNGKFIRMYRDNSLCAYPNFKSLILDTPSPSCYCFYFLGAWRISAYNHKVVKHNIFNYIFSRFL